MEILHALRSQLSWTHFRELIGIEDPLKRQFYAEVAIGPRGRPTLSRSCNRPTMVPGRQGYIDVAREDSVWLEDKLALAETRFAPRFGSKLEKELRHVG